MRRHLFTRVAILAAAIFMIAGLLLVDSNAQKRKRRRKSSAPRITNPEIYQPTNSNASADTNVSNDNANTNTNTAPNQSSEDPESMKRTIRTLANQVDKLTDKLSQMEQSQRSMVDMERLSRAEQRSAQLHGELRDVQAKKADLEAHLEDVNYALQPENIERATQGYGTTHPEEVREQRRKQLETERDRVQKQIDQLKQSEDRLQQAVAASDAEVDTLQKKLDAADRAAIENAKTKAETESPAQPYASPTPTPSP